VRVGIVRFGPALTVGATLPVLVRVPVIEPHVSPAT
jgi:hypothetical protein